MRCKGGPAATKMHIVTVIYCMKCNFCDINDIMLLEFREIGLESEGKFRKFCGLNEWEHVVGQCHITKMVIINVVNQPYLVKRMKDAGIWS